jgi:hypothetical protein
VEAGVQPRVSAREAYPRRAEHNTIAEGGYRGWAETPSAERARSGQYLAEIGRDGIGEGHPTRKATKGFLGRRVRQRGRRIGGAPCANPTTASSAPSETG